jgi:photosystem II stability/assembly factor-like uncharacterized protein
MKKYFFTSLAFVFLTFTFLNAQWVIKNDGFDPISFSQIVKSGDNLIGISMNDGIYVSTDKGDNWQLTSDILVSGAVLKSIVLNEYIFIAQKNGGIFVSSDHGLIWEKKNNGLPQLYVYDILAFDNEVYITTRDSGVYKTTNYGDNWLKISKGIESVKITALGQADGVLYAGSKFGDLYKSTDKGQNWSILDFEVTRKQTVEQILKVDGGLFLSAYQVFSYSTDNGLSWERKYFTDSSITVYKLFLLDDVLHIITSIGVLKTTDAGDTWELAFKNENSTITDLLIDNGVYYCCLSKGVVVSTDNGKTWSEKKNGLIKENIYSLHLHKNQVFAATDDNGIYSSSDHGDNWTKKCFGYAYNWINSLCSKGDSLIFGKDTYTFFSTDDGYTWDTLHNFMKGYFRTLLIDNDTVFIGTNKGVILSTDNGVTWQNKWEETDSSYIEKLFKHNEKVYAGTFYSGLLISTNNGENWNYCNIEPKLSFNCFDASGDTVVIGTDQGIFFSTDDGNTWTECNSAFSDLYVYDILLLNDYIIFGTDHGLYISKDFFASWKESDIQLNNLKVYALLYDNEYIYAGCKKEGIFRTTFEELITGVDDNHTETNGFQVYPNPADDILFIESGGALNRNYIEIINISGETVLRYTLIGDTATINIAQLPAGVYFVRCGSVARLFVKK